MEIYTGYYNKVKEYKDLKLQTISISRTEPKSIVIDGKIQELCPNNNILWDFKNGKIDEAEYTSEYLSQLDNIGIKNILLKIHHFGDNVILLCWESPEKFCHRHILADYINEHSLLKVVEYEKVV